ncbi:APOPT1 isoform 11, partial [Pongo abelii]
AFACRGCQLAPERGAERRDTAPSGPPQAFLQVRSRPIPNSLAAPRLPHQRPRSDGTEGAAATTSGTVDSQNL